MTPTRAESIDYTSQCTVCVDYDDSGRADRLVYERPRMQVPDRPLTDLERVTITQYATDAELAEEARGIFADLQSKGRIGPHAVLGRIFIARTAAAALEMNL
jgi:hypothetical protein